MRPVLWCNHTPSVVQVYQMCRLAGEAHVTEAALEAAGLAPLELAVLYDYAVRVHLSASDNPVLVRRRPALLDLVPRALTQEQRLLCGAALDAGHDEMAAYELASSTAEELAVLRAKLELPT